MRRSPLSRSDQSVWIRALTNRTPHLSLASIVVLLVILAKGPDVHVEDDAIERSAECSLAIMASLMAYMQHTDEQYPLPHRLVSREPTHWSQAIFFGSVWSEGRTRCPMVGPEALKIRSNSRLVSTLGCSCSDNTLQVRTDQRARCRDTE